MHSGAGLLKAQNIHVRCSDPAEVTAWTQAHSNTFINALPQAHRESGQIPSFQNSLRAGETAPQAKVLRAKPDILIQPSEHTWKERTVFYK